MLFTMRTTTSLLVAVMKSTCIFFTFLRPTLPLSQPDMFKKSMMRLGARILTRTLLTPKRFCQSRRTSSFNFFVLTFFFLIPFFTTSFLPPYIYDPHDHFSLAAIFLVSRKFHMGTRIYTSLSLSETTSPINVRGRDITSHFQRYIIITVDFCVLCRR